MCVSNRIEQFSASYFRAGSAPPVPPPSKGPAEADPERGEEDITLLLRFGMLAVSVPKHPTGLGVDAVVVGLGLGGDGGGNSLHDRLLSLLKARATSALDYLEQKLIYIYHR